MALDAEAANGDREQDTTRPRWGRKPEELFALLGSRVRWAIIEILADGRSRTATEVAELLKRDFDGVSKHMRLMREAGLLDGRYGEDRRYLFFSLPARLQPAPDRLDFGFCTIQLPGRPTPSQASSSSA